MGCSCPPLSFWSNTRRRGNISSLHFYFTKRLPQRKSLWTMKNNHIEICTSKPFLWDAEVEAAGRTVLNARVSQNPLPICFPWMQIDTDHLEAYPKFKSLNKLFSNSKEDLKIKKKILGIHSAHQTWGWLSFYPVIIRQSTMEKGRGMRGEVTAGREGSGRRALGRKPERTGKWPAWRSFGGLQYCFTKMQLYHGIQTSLFFWTKYSSAQAWRRASKLRVEEARSKEQHYKVGSPRPWRSHGGERGVTWSKESRQWLRTVSST